MLTVSSLEQELLAGRTLNAHVGDDVRVHVKITDGEKSRIQIFEGTVIAIKHGGPRTTITVRKTSFGVGVERVFPVFAPTVDKIEVKVRHNVRRAKLYYLRQRSGKSARLKEVGYGKS
ncbi:MAG: 50S ribosomal protein L19 [Myxococcales bacterium]|nr:50S ribosomal protein L19 [Myxococcales bacterium]